MEVLPAVWYWDCLQFSLYSDVVAVARSKMLRILKKGIILGSLEIIDFDGKKHLFGTSQSEHRHAKVFIGDEQFWARVYLSYELGCVFYSCLLPDCR